MIIFRKADYIDVATLSNLYERSFDDISKSHQNFDIKTIQDEYHKGYISYLMYDNQELIGAHSFVQSKPDTVYVSHIAVLPEFQRKGYARKLFEHRELEMSKFDGIKYQESHILFDTTQGIKNFYESYGYKSVKTFDLGGSKIVESRKTLKSNGMLTVKDNFKDYHDDIYKFCLLAEYETTNKELKKNMSVMYWKNRPESLLYQLYKARSFELLSLRYDGDKIISFSGCGKLDFDNNTLLICRRLYCLKEYRKQWKNSDGFVEQYNWAVDNNYKVVLATFNDYNVNIFEKFRARKTKNETIFRALFHVKSDNIYFYPKQVKICETMQWVIIIYIDDTYFLRFK